MLTTYVRVMSEWRKRDTMQVKLLKARLERRVPRDRPRDERHVVSSAIVALLVKRANEGGEK